MSSNTSSENSNGIANLNEEENFGRSLFRDSLERLARNRLAMIGLVVVILNILIAVFADFIAPRSFATQILEDHDAAPAWVMKVFPILSPHDETWDVGGGTPVVENGDHVSTNQLLISYSDQQLVAAEDAKVFVDDRRVNLFPPDADIPEFTLPSADTIVEAGARVSAGDVLFGDTVSPIEGTIVRTGDTIWVMPRTSWRSGLGDVLVETGQTVAAGDPLISTDEGDIVAPVAGTIFAGRSSIDLWVLPVEHLTIPDGADVKIRATLSSKAVTQGEALFDDVTSPIDGVAYQVDNEMLIFREQSWEFGEGIPIVENGETVSAGQELVDFTPLNVYANMDGYAVIHDGEFILSPLQPTVFKLEDGIAPVVADAQTVQIGQTLFGSTTTTIAGTAYLSDNELIVLPKNTGYVTQRNEYLLGADNLGRDMLSRIIFGARISLAVAFVGPFFATMIGVSVGLLSGYRGGWVDNLIMRIVDVFYAFPTLLLIILMMAYFRSGAFSRPGSEGTIGFYMYNLDKSMGGMLFIFIGIGLTSWLGLARLTRGQVLSARENDYILAANAMGASQFQVVFKHILPNVIGPLIVAETLTIPGYISYEAFLSFIGLGVSAPTPSWGQMISDGAASIGSYPFQAIFPALALFIIMFAFNFLGDGLRDAFDPRLRGTD